MKNRKSFLIIAALFCCLSIILGAFGAHFFETRLSPSSLNAYDTACTYMMYQGLALFIFILLEKHLERGIPNFVLYGISIGTILFSGSILLLATRSYSGLPVGFLGPVTPIGGMILILSWLSLIVVFVKIKTS